MISQAVRRIGYWIIGIAIGVFSLALLVVYGGPYAVRFVLHELPFMGKTFDPVEWAQAGSCTGLTDWTCEQKWRGCPRGSMVRTLLRDHLVIGKTRKADAVALLGRPDRVYPRDQKICLNYLLGYCSGLGVDYDHVEACFDDSDVLQSKRHFQS